MTFALICCSIHLDRHLVKVVLPELCKRPELEWCKAEMKSFAIAICGTRHLCEYTFRVRDGRRLSKKEKKLAVLNSTVPSSKKLAESRSKESLNKLEGYADTAEQNTGEIDLQRSNPETIETQEDGPKATISGGEAATSGPKTLLQKPTSPLNGAGRSFMSGKMTVTQLRQEIDWINRRLREWKPLWMQRTHTKSSMTH
jgi:hypothetical protein